MLWDHSEIVGRIEIQVKTCGWKDWLASSALFCTFPPEYFIHDSIQLHSYFSKPMSSLFTYRRPASLRPCTSRNALLPLKNVTRPIPAAAGSV